MSKSLDVVRNEILASGGVEDHHLQATLSRLLEHRLDEAEIYFQSTRSESWMLEGGIVKNGSHRIAQGFGVRAISGEKSGFAYADEVAPQALAAAADAARKIARSGGEGSLQVWRRDRDRASLYPTIDPIDTFDERARIDLLERVDAEARRIDPHVSEVLVSLAGEHDRILVVSSDGTFAADVRPLVRMAVRVIVERNGRREQASSGGGGRFDYRHFLEEGRVQEYAREAVRQALVNLDAEPAPAGTMVTVLGPGWPGVLLHEAVGHGLEGDFNRKGSSAFSGRIGERVASDQCTIVDDGSLPGRRGSLSVDDEGIPTGCTTLIENGILKGYMQDKLNARLTGTAPTGNGRRESYAHLPMPRMTNTYMLAGDRDPGEIIESVDKGLYAVQFGGGQVDITSGKFVFAATEAYLIEGGRITRPVKGATLIGNGPEVLTRVSMVGNDLQLDSGIGNCGKAGQWVPVGVGQPTMRIDGLTVGGTAVGE